MCCLMIYKMMLHCKRFGAVIAVIWLLTIVSSDALKESFSVQMICCTHYNYIASPQYVLSVSVKEHLSVQRLFSLITIVWLLPSMSSLMPHKIFFYSKKSCYSNCSYVASLQMKKSHPFVCLSVNVPKNPGCFSILIKLKPNFICCLTIVFPVTNMDYLKLFSLSIS